MYISGFALKTFDMMIDSAVMQGQLQEWTEHSTDKRTDFLSRPSCIYTQIFNPKKTVYFHFSGSKKFFFNLFYIKGIMQLFSADSTVFKKKC